MLGGKAVVNWHLEFDSTSLSPQNNAYATANASGTPVTSDPTQGSCTTTPSNSVTITKNCGVPANYPNGKLPGTQLVTQSGLAAVQTNFSGDICNGGQTPLNNITLTDNQGGTLTVAWPGSAGSLGPGVCAKYSGNYLPTGVTFGDLGTTATGRYSFSDEIKVTGATATLGKAPGPDGACVSNFATGAQACGGATCNICPGYATCGGP
jgi:hypothetical protein